MISTLTFWLLLSFCVLFCAQGLVVNLDFGNSIAIGREGGVAPLIALARSNAEVSFKFVCCSPPNCHCGIKFSSIISDVDL